MNDASVQCSALLKEFRLVSPKEAYAKFEPSCVSKETLSLLLAHGLDSDVVVYIYLFRPWHYQPNRFCITSINNHVEIKEGFKKAIGAESQ
jgi:hypothetical protein